MSRARAGFTFLETLIVTALMTLLLTLTWQVLRPSLQIWEINQAKADIEQAGLLLEYRMTKEMIASTADSLSVLPSGAITTPPASFLAFNSDSAGGYDTTSGEPIWSKFIIYYLDTDNHILYRKEWPNSALAVQMPPLSYTFPTTTPIKLSASDLQDICTTENFTERRAAWYVLDIAASEVANGAIELKVQLSTESVGGIELALRQFELRMRN